MPSDWQLRTNYGRGHSNALDKFLFLGFGKIILMIIILVPFSFMSSAFVYITQYPKIFDTLFLPGLFFIVLFSVIFYKGWNVFLSIYLYLGGWCLFIVIIVDSILGVEGTIFSFILLLIYTYLSYAFLKSEKTEDKKDKVNQ
jgi:hypothetical protein